MPYLLFPSTIKTTANTAIIYKIGSKTCTKPRGSFPSFCDTRNIDQRPSIEQKLNITLKIQSAPYHNLLKWIAQALTVQVRISFLHTNLNNWEQVISLQRCAISSLISGANSAGHVLGLGITGLTKPFCSAYLLHMSETSKGFTSPA